MTGMELFKEMSLKSKIYCAFAVAACVVGLIGGYGIVQIKNIDASHATSQEIAALPVAALGNMTRALEQERTALQTLLATKETAESKDLPGSLQGLEQSIAAAITILEKTAVSPEDTTQIAVLKDTRAAYSSRKDRAIQLALKNKLDDAAGILRDPQTVKSAATVQATVQKLLGEKSLRLEKASAGSEHSSRFLGE